MEISLGLRLSQLVIRGSISGISYDWFFSIICRD